MLFDKTTATGSIGVSGSLVSAQEMVVSGSGSITGNLTVVGRMNATASFVETASYAEFSGSPVITGSMFITGSSVIIGAAVYTGSFSVTGSMRISGSTQFTGSTVFLGNNTVSGSIRVSGSYESSDFAGNLDGTASYAVISLKALSSSSNGKPYLPYFGTRTNYTESYFDNVNVWLTEGAYALVTMSIAATGTYETTLCANVAVSGSFPSQSLTRYQDVRFQRFVTNISGNLGGVTYIFGQTDDSNQRTQTVFQSQRIAVTSPGAIHNYFFLGYSCSYQLVGNKNNYVSIEKISDEY